MTVEIDGVPAGVTAQTTIEALAPIGYIESANRNIIVGWLYDPELAQGETAILEIEGIPAFGVLTTIDRADVVAAGVAATSLVGFEVFVADELKRRLEHRATGNRPVRLISRGHIVATVAVDQTTPIGSADAGEPAIEPFTRSIPPRRKSPDSDRPRLLSIVAAGGGGTPQTNLDLMRGVQSAYEPYILTAGPGYLHLASVKGSEQIEWRRKLIDEPVDPVTHDSCAYAVAIADVLDDGQFDLVHVRHLAWHGLSVIAAAKARTIPVLMSFHDYYTLCPTVKLLDEHNKFCGGVCTEGRGPCRPDLWPPSSLQPLKNNRVHAWRRNFEKALAECDHFVTTSALARQLILSHLPSLADRPFNVISHGRDFSGMGSIAPPLQAGERFRIAVPGNISMAKGASIVAALAADPRFEVHIFGQAASFLETTPAVLHGPYERENIGARLAEVQPHVGLIASLWPETYCHTLTELWAAGVPVAAFDMGAVGERIRQHGGGWLAAEPTAYAMHDILLAMIAQPAAMAAARRDVARIRTTMLRHETIAAMSERYMQIYSMLLGRAPENARL